METVIPCMQNVTEKMTAEIPVTREIAQRSVKSVRVQKRSVTMENVFPCKQDVMEKMTAEIPAMREIVQK